MNSEQQVLITRLVEAEISLNRFFKVKDNKAPDEPEGYMGHLKTPEQMDQLGFTRWGICGGDFLVPIDTDDKRMYDILTDILPKTFEVTSPRRGLPHKFYVVCGEQDVGNYTLHIPGINDEQGRPKAMGEIRNRNQYVVAAGTEITFKDRETNEPKTGMYRVSQNIPIARMEYADFMEKIKPYIQNSNGADPQRFTDKEQLNGVDEGERHAKGLRCADGWLAKGSGYQVAMTALQKFNEKCTPTPMSEKDLIHIMDCAVGFIATKKKITRKEVVDGWDEAHPIAKEKPKDKKSKESQADIVLTLFFNENIELFHDQYGTAFATVPNLDGIYAIDDISETLGDNNNFLKTNVIPNSSGKAVNGVNAVKDSEIQTVNIRADEVDWEKKRDEYITNGYIVTKSHSLGVTLQKFPTIINLWTNTATWESERDNFLAHGYVITKYLPMSLILEKREEKPECLSKVITRLTDESFKSYLAHLYYDATRKALGTDAVSSVVLLLNYYASVGKKYTLYNRVAPDPEGNGIWLDMADSKNRAYHITKEGWILEEKVPILFRRYDTQKALPEAVKGGDAWKLFEFVNVGKSKNVEYIERKKLLLMVQTASCLIPEIPHPINMMFGCAGARKSTAQRFIRSTIDPSNAPLLRTPKDITEATQNLDHHYMPVFDNLTAMPGWFSDLLCQAVTGAGIETRALYTDDESFIRNFRRCVLLNGLNLPAKKGDLLNRGILHQLEPDPDGRLTEKELNNAFNKVHPEILGGLLDVVVKALGLIDAVKITEKFRLLDFTEWGCALAIAFDRTQEDFIASMKENQENQNSADIENNICADAFLSYCEKWASAATEDDPVVGTPDEIFSLVSSEANSLKISTTGKRWPPSASAFTRKLNDSKGSIIANSYTYEVIPKGTRREMRIWSLKPKEKKKEPVIISAHKLDYGEHEIGVCPKCKNNGHIEYEVKFASGEIQRVCFACGNQASNKLYEDSQK